MTTEAAATRPRALPRPRVGAMVGALGSVVVHAAALGYVVWGATTPPLDIELGLPSEVEFGLTEAMTVESGPPGGVQPAAQAAPPPEPPSEPEDAQEGLPAVDAGARRRERDAGPPADAGVPADAGSGPDLVASDDPGEGDRPQGEGSAVGGEGTGATELPPGAQIAMRLDMARIRRSPLAEDVRRVLGEIPDWQIVLAGSGIEPLDDLDRVLIASPNLQRSRMLLAGRYEGDVNRVREIVSRMAAAAGVEASWRTEHGVEVARWPDADETERVIALVGPRHFTITRPEDLPRLLAVARVRAEEETPEGAEQPPGADALLSMPDGAALTLEVEGARQFARGPRGVPARAAVVVTERSGGGAEIVVTGTYDSPEQAEEALAFWDRAREAYAGNLLVAAVGMSSTLRDMELSAEAEVLRARTTLSAQQLRLVLGYVHGMLRDQAARRERASRPAPGSVPSPPQP